MFRFLRDVARSGFRDAVLDRRRGGVRGIRSLAARRQTDVEIAVQIGDDSDDAAWEYELAFHQDRQRRPRIRTERVRRGGETLVDRPGSEDDADPERLTQTHLEQVNVNQPFRDLAAFFGSIRYLHLVPQLVREPDRSAGLTNDPFGGDFLEQIAKTPERTRTARLGASSAPCAPPFRNWRRSTCGATPAAHPICGAATGTGAPPGRGTARSTSRTGRCA